MNRILIALLTLAAASSAWACEEHEMGVGLSVLNTSFNYSRGEQGAAITALGEIENPTPTRAEDVVVERSAPQE